MRRQFPGRSHLFVLAEPLGARPITDSSNDKVIHRDPADRYIDVSPGHREHKRLFGRRYTERRRFEAWLVTALSTGVPWLPVSALPVPLTATDQALTAVAHDTNMTTSTTPQTPIHRNITSTRGAGRIAILLAGSALAVAVIGVAVQPDSGSTGSNAIANIEAPRSALLDGPALQTAIDATIANIEAPRSALLDGPALQTAIDAILDADAR